MMDVSSDENRRVNRLLAAMPSAILERHLERVALTARETLFEGGAALEHVYFPHSGVICLMASMRDEVAETATIGPEGFVGFEAVLSGNTAANRAMVQVSGAASRIPIVILRSLMDDCPPIRELLLRYVRFFLIQALQSVACNGLHAVGQHKLVLIQGRRATIPSVPKLAQFSGYPVGTSPAKCSIL